MSRRARSPLASGLAIGLGLALVGAPAAAERRVPLAPHELHAYRFAPTVGAIAQDPDGYLWFATQRGLGRHDGLSFDGATAATGRPLGGAGPGQLLLTSGGEAFLALARPGGDGKNDAGLLRGPWGALAPVAAAAHERVWALAAATTEAALWLGTSQGLARLDGDRLSWAARADETGAVRALLPDADGGLFIGAERGLYHRAPDGGLRRLAAGAVTALAQDARTLWFGGPEGLFAYDRAGGTARPAPPGAPPRNVSALLVDRTGALWCGSDHSLVRFEGDQARRYGRDEGLPDEKVLALFEDREGGVWVGTRAGGAARISAARTWNIGAAEGLPGETAFAVLAASDGAVWATSTAGVSRWRDDELEVFAYGPRFAVGGSLRTISEDDEGRVWFSAGARGVAVHDRGRWSTHPVSFDRRQRVKAASADRAGGLWVAFDEGGVARVDRGTLAVTETHALDEGACRGVFGAFAAGAAGGVWMGSNEGAIVRLGAGGVRCWTAADGLPARRVSALFEDDRGDLLAAFSHGAGLVRLRDGRAAVVGGAQLGLPDVYGLAQGASGDLWAATGQGVYRVPREALDALFDGRARGLRARRFGAAAGLRSEETTAGFARPIAATADGRVWAATLLGLAVVRQDEGAAVGPAPRPVIERLVVDGVRASAAEAARLPAGTKTLELGFTAPSFAAPETLRFEYRLQGMDDRWIAVGDGRTVRFGFLPAGSYTFAVRLAAPELGAAAPPLATLALSIAPHFHRTPTFFGLLALAAAALVVAAHRLRLRQVAARFQAVQQERARIARDLHDDVAQAFTTVGYHLDALANTVEPGAPAAALVERTRQIVDRAQTETRRAVWDLRAEGLGQPPLADRLRTMAEELEATGRAAVRVEAAGLPALASWIEHEALLVAREAVTNALRHAEARAVRIAARLSEDALVLTVEDDGRGLAPERAGGPAAGPAGGFGIVGMTERAMQMGGALVVEPVPAGGTRVTLTVPARLARRKERP